MSVNKLSSPATSQCFVSGKSVVGRPTECYFPSARPLSHWVTKCAPPRTARDRRGEDRFVRSAEFRPTILASRRSYPPLPQYG